MPFKILVFLSFIRFTICKRIKHKKNRSALDMTVLCVSLAVQEILRIFHEYYDEISITCAIKKELHHCFVHVTPHILEIRATEMN